MVFFKRLVTFSRSYSSWSSPKKTSSGLAKQFVSEFKDFYSELVDSTIAKTEYLQFPGLQAHMKKLSEYYTLQKFPLQGESLVSAYELLEKPGNITESKKRQAFTLACFIETCQAYFIIADDILDGGEIRNEKVCWHQLPGVGLTAINDISMLRSFINEYLRLNIDGSIYSQVMNVINEQYFRLEVGQRMDLTMATSKNYENFTMELYTQKEVLKSSYYCLITPIRLALILSNNANEESFKNVKDIFSDLGILVQIHNDFTEYLEMADSMRTCKSCTDVPEGKLGWVSVKALELCNPEQRKVFEANYGSYDPDKLEQIKKLYEEIGVRKLYTKEAERRYDIYLKKVKDLPADSVPSQDFFIKFLDLFRKYTDDLSRYYYI